MERREKTMLALLHKYYFPILIIILFMIGILSQRLKDRT